MWKAASCKLLWLAAAALLVGCRSSTDSGCCIAGTNIVGDACANDFECDSDVCTEGLCAPPPPREVIVGGSCSRQDCVALATCVDGTCVEGNPDTEGEPCLEADDCDTGETCIAGVCTVSSGSGGASGAGGASGQGGAGGTSGHGGDGTGGKG
jgi:hypothetical protein